MYDITRTNNHNWYIWVKYDYTPQIWANWGSNPLSPDHGSTFHVTEMHVFFCEFFFYRKKCTAALHYLKSLRWVFKRNALAFRDASLGCKFLTAYWISLFINKIVHIAVKYHVCCHCIIWWNHNFIGVCGQIMNVKTCYVKLKTFLCSLLSCRNEVLKLENKTNQPWWWKTAARLFALEMIRPRE